MVAVATRASGCCTGCDDGSSPADLMARWRRRGLRAFDAETDAPTAGNNSIADSPVIGFHPHALTRITERNLRPEWVEGCPPAGRSRHSRAHSLPRPRSQEAMKVTYDQDADAFYARFAPDGTPIAETKDVAPNVNIDLDERGTSSASKSSTFAYARSDRLTRNTLPSRAYVRAFGPVVVGLAADGRTGPHDSGGLARCDARRGASRCVPPMRPSRAHRQVVPGERRFLPYQRV